MKLLIQNRMFRLSLIICISFLASCTVTKRVHRSGYHIEWKKNYANSSKDKSDEITELNTEDENKSTANPSNISESSDSLLPIYEAEVSVFELDENDVEPFRLSGFDVETFSNGVEESNELGTDQTTSVHRNLSGAVNKSIGQGGADIGGAFITIGIWFIIIGSLFILASLLLIFGGYGLNYLFDALVFSGNGFFVGVLGFILFLIILIVLLLFVFMIEYLLGGPFIGLIVGLSLLLVGILLVALI